MKLEKLFKTDNNRLFSLDGTEIPVTSAMILQIRWTEIEPGDPESYDEEFLANLRLLLKDKEQKQEFVFIEPILDKPSHEYETFIAAVKHTARRIKDCISVMGFAVPDQLAAAGFEEGSSAVLFMSELSEKHAQYVYFCKSSCPASIVRYGM